MNWNAIWLSLRLAFFASVVLLFVGMPIAYWLTYARYRWKFLAEAVVSLPLVLPPTVLGYYVLVGTAPDTLVGRAYQSVFGRTLPFTFSGLLVASVLYSLPFAVQPFASGFASVDMKLIHASSVLGASRWRTFWRIIFPLSLNSLVTGSILSFAHTLGEFGVVLMVGGNIPGVTHTVSIDIYDQVQAMNHAAANATALALLIFSFCVLSVVYAINRKAWAPWPDKSI